jgi:FkbM family methyltransferase
MRPWYLGVVAALCVVSVISLMVFELMGRVRTLEANLAAMQAHAGESEATDLHGSEIDGTATESSSNIRTPLRNGRPMSLPARLRYLEKKVSGALNWVRRPHVWYEWEQFACKNQTTFGEQHGAHICLDFLNEQIERRRKQGISPPCVIYDFGIRKEPHFGVQFATIYGCEVHGFDPSPVTLAWLKDSGLEKVPNYHFHPYGAAGDDNPLPLFDYNWDQVSVVEFGPYEKFLEGGRGKQMYYHQPKHMLPVKTLRTIMKELGHTYVDMVKLDIEGSEYLFLEDMFDTIGCPPFGQLAAEWHHFSMDSRYGTPREIQVLINLLNDCGLQQFWSRTWWYDDTIIDQNADGTAVRKRFGYNVASFVQTDPRFIPLS